MATRIAQWAFCALLLAIGLTLAIQGAQLISLGGSWYYSLAGVGAIAVAVLTAIRNAWGPRLYAAILAVTVVWSIAEAGLDLMALLPRLAAWIVVGAWFLSPWHGAAMRTHSVGSISGAKWVGAAQAAGILLLAVAAMQHGKVVEGTRATLADASPVTDWRNYGASTKGTRFVALDQITPDNVGQLKEIWRFRTGVPYDFKNTPLEVDGTVYVCTAGSIAIALDAATGAEKWRHDPKTKIPGAEGGDLSKASTFARSCRGLGYHEGAPDSAGQCVKRIIAGTTDGRLVAFDALTGVSCKDFGFGGEVNLQSGLGPHPDGEYMVTSAPLVARDIVVVGGWVTDNQELGNVSGVLRAYDANTGQFVWAWDMGKPGFHGLPEEGGEYTRGTPNSWSTMSYDPELNLVFAPTGNASPDYYGPKRRPFDEKYASSTVALDAATGEPRWSYQTVHHDIWDWDVPAQPVLVDITKDGQSIPVVVQPTKRGEVFVMDRRDGTPVWPATTCPDGKPAQAGGECPVPQNPIEGEFVTATQPFSGLPHFRPDRLEQDMWGLTPLDQLHCRIEYKKMRYEGPFTPPMTGGGGRGTGKPTFGGTFQYPGNAGGFNWPSVSVDADNGLLVVQPMMIGNRIVMVTQDVWAKASGLPPEMIAAFRSSYTTQGEWDPKVARYGLTSPFMSTWAIPFTKIRTRLPCFEPPYGKLGVIDLNTGKLLWSRPIGTMETAGPFGIGTGLPLEVGTAIYGGTMTTRGGLIFQVGTMDSKMRAVDLRTGKTKWTARLPGSSNGTPISFVAPQDGRQYVVISIPNPGLSVDNQGYPIASGPPTDDMGGYVIAYALPAAAGK